MWLEQFLSISSYLCAGLFLSVGGCYRNWLVIYEYVRYGQRATAGSKQRKTQEKLPLIGGLSGLPRKEDGSIINYAANAQTHKPKIVSLPVSLPSPGSECVKKN